MSKKSLVDYSKLESRPQAPTRSHAQPKGPAAPPPSAVASTTAAAVPTQSSATMQAVMRLMTGKEERTIAEKFQDANRPTWEQYKVDNSDKLNLEGADQKQMEEYRKELDAQRDAILSRGLNHKKKKDGKKSKKSKKVKKKKHSKKKRRRDDRSDQKDSDNDNDSSDESPTSSEESDDSRKHKRKKHKKRKKDKKKKKKRRNESDSEDSEGSHYRLSNFFANDDWRRRVKHKKNKLELGRSNDDDDE